MVITPIMADWPVPKYVKSYTTTRQGGVSQGNYAGLNLAYHVQDCIEHVTENRRLLAEHLALPKKPVWLDQVHGTTVITLPMTQQSTLPRADAVYTQTANTPCIVMTADCLPVLFCSSLGNEVAAAHAGWRGLYAGILENTVSQFNAQRSHIMAWLGPAIGPSCFEIGDEVRALFLQQDHNAAAAFAMYDHRYLANIYLLAKQRLQRAGLCETNIYGGNHCTMSDSKHFYSYRRHQQTGRMASLIWFTEPN